MKLKSTTLSSLTLVLILCCGWFEFSYAHNSEKEDISLLEAIEKISKEFEVYFTFDMNIVAEVRVEYNHTSYQNADEAITSILLGTDLKYKLYDHRFVILYKEDAVGLESLRTMSHHLDGLISEGEKIFNTSPKTEVRIVPLLTNYTLSKTISPVAFSVEGTVVDQSGEPLIGVNIQVKGSNQGTATDFEGRFTLGDIEDNAVLVVSYIGYQTQEVPVTGKSVLTITLISDSQLLDEVVVVGYGTQKKTSLTSAVSSIKGEEINSIPVTNVSNSIAGRLAGVIVKQESGEPGVDGSRIYIRGISTIGSTQPLLIVDGVPRDFQHLDPNSIETFTVLKDAAAVAPYGVAGANGVILVTTKEGIKGDALITYNGSVGYQNPTILSDLVNGYEYATLRNLAAENVGLPKPYTDEEVQKFKDGSEPDRYPPFYDIWSTVRNENALLNKHSINVLGGSDEFRYFVNLGYQDQQGMWPSSHGKNYNLTINLNGKLTTTTSLSLKINGNYNFATQPSTDFISSRTQSRVRLFETIKYIHPGTYGPYKFSNGDHGTYPGASIETSGYWDFKETEIFSQISLKQEIPFIKGMDITGNISYDPRFGINKLWSLPVRYSFLDLTQSPPKISEKISGKTKPTLQNQWDHSRQLTYQARLNYANTFNKHDINVIGVFEAIDNRYISVGASRRNYNLYIDEVDMGSSSNDDMTTSGGSSQSSQVGLVYRVAYGYDNKYMLEASGRYDGHYYFAPDKRFGFFPAFSIGWRISEEQFINNSMPWLYNLKFRASYGEVGALAGGPFQYLSSFGVRGPGYSIGGNGQQVVFERSEPNPNITWERARKTNVGLDFSLWQGIFNLEADYFYEKRSNMLIAPDVITPLEYGIGLSQVNEAVMENRGVEFLTSSNFNITKDLVIGLGGTFTYAKNKVLEIYETSTTYNNPNRRRTGRPLGTQFGYKEMGYFVEQDFDQEGNLKPGIAIQPWGQVFPGDIRYEDSNNDGEITPEDHVPIGDPSTPGIIYGISPSIKFKSFSLEVLFQGASNTSHYFSHSAIWPFSNNQSAYKQNFDYWRPNNLDAEFPRLTPGLITNNIQTSSKWMYDVSYFRLKSAKLSFDLPSNLINSIHLQKAQVYLSGQNILTWTKSFVGEFLDPETVSRDGYPHQKVISAGIQVSL